MTMLDELLKEFRPQFGNMKHVAINEKVGKIMKLREHVMKHAARVKSLERAVARKTQAEKNLEQSEASLIRELKTELNV